MKIHSTPSGAVMTGSHSPLCTVEFTTPPAGLPVVLPPNWMRRGFVCAVIGMLSCAMLVLFSPMDEFVIAPGEVRPSDFSYVFSKSSGILESVLVKDGQVVEKGQVLARLDPWEYRKNIERIEGEIAQAKAELEFTRATVRKVNAAPVPPEFLFSSLEVERQKDMQEIQQEFMARLNELRKTGAASGSEVLNLRMQLIASETLLKRSQQAHELYTGSYGDAAREEAAGREKVAEARLAILETNLAQAKKDLERLDILATESGTILSTASRYPGERVQDGEALFKVTGTTGTELRLYATEDRVNRLQPGQMVRFRANNNPDRLAPLATGRVTDVALDRDLEPMEGQHLANASYRIKVAVENAPYPLAVGATVQAEVVIDRRSFWRLLFLKAANKG